jgi:hypothetical protein
MSISTGLEAVVGGATAAGALPPTARPLERINAPK